MMRHSILIKGITYNSSKNIKSNKKIATTTNSSSVNNPTAMLSTPNGSTANISSNPSVVSTKEQNQSLKPTLTPQQSNASIITTPTEQLSYTLNMPYVAFFIANRLAGERPEIDLQPVSFTTNTNNSNVDLSHFTITGDITWPAAEKCQSNTLVPINELNSHLTFPVFPLSCWLSVDAGEIAILRIYFQCLDEAKCTDKSALYGSTTEFDANIPLDSNGLANSSGIQHL